MSISRVHGGAGGGGGGGPGALIALPRRVMVRKSIWQHERPRSAGGRAEAGFGVVLSERVRTNLRGVTCVSLQE